MLPRIIAVYVSGIKLLFLPHVPSKVKIAVIMFIIFYFAIPFDFIPDFLPLIGIADELTLFYLLFHFLLKKYPSDVKSKSPIIDAEIVQ